MRTYRQILTQQSGLNHRNMNGCWVTDYANIHASSMNGSGVEGEMEVDGGLFVPRFQAGNKWVKRRSPNFRC